MAIFSPMLKVGRILILWVLFCFTTNCEKDDICVSGDAPLLVLGFFNINDTTVAKRVNTLRIRALGFDTSPTTFQDRSRVDSVGIPLKIDDISTGFVLIKGSADDDNGMETGNSDTLTFNYTVKDRFVSRGCGFVANFTELDTMRNVFSTDWIKRITVVEPNVQSSNQIHVKIFH